MLSAGESSPLFAVSRWTAGAPQDKQPSRPGMSILRRIRERRAEKKADRRAIALAMQQSHRAGEERSPEQLDAAVDRASSQFPNSY
jgi:hypothetical protein